ncbi:MAG TPA: sodium:solute symporter, partial [Thermoanaerobaculia bacterium]|nr:sodium:solute symporter [Thermoanaerobaculia bacterium]
MVVTTDPLDLAVLLAYVGGVVAFGASYARRSRGTREFTAAGGRLGGWAVGLSIFATFLSSNTFLGVPGRAFASNWNAFVFSLSLPPAAWIAARWFVPFYRRHGHISAYHHLEARFGPWARTYGLACYLLTQLARMGSVLFGVALVTTALTGWSMAATILAVGVLVTLYTLVGGIEAVIWTDVVQSFVLVGGALAVLWAILGGTPGGVERVLADAGQAGKLDLGSFAADFSTSTFWVVLLYGLFINLNNFGIDQSYVQRYHTSRTTPEARRSVWLAAALYLPVSLLFFFLGSAMWVFYSAQPELAADLVAAVGAGSPDGAAGTGGAGAPAGTTAAALDGLSHPKVGDRALPHFIATQLPPGVTGLLVAAMLAAAMSSLDTSLNSSATVLLTDVYTTYIRPGADERESMRFLRGATFAMGAIGIATALAMMGVESLLDAWWTLSGIFAGGLLGLFLLGMIARRADRPSAVAGVVAGVTVIL